jgi:hypothetical protein
MRCLLGRRRGAATVLAWRPAGAELPTLTYLCPTRAGRGLLLRTTAAMPILKQEYRDHAAAVARIDRWYREETR